MKHFVWLFIGLVLGMAIGIHFADIREINSVIAAPQTMAQAVRSNLLPQSHFYIEHSGYCLSYDGRLKQASWVCEELSQDSLSPAEVVSAKRVFKEDPCLPKIVRSTLNDYRNSSFDRGHLACAADHKANQEAFDDTFFLSNISPQVPEFNQNLWLKLEKYARKLTEKHNKVTVITGPLFLPKKGKDGKSFVRYEVIGPNLVAVPTHYFKIIVTSTHQEAFILPNKSIDPKAPLSKFKVSTDKVQKLSGLHLNAIPTKDSN